MPQAGHEISKKQKKMAPDHVFKFNCYPGVACFTQCCQDVTIVLTPYDVLRLKRALGISSDLFLDRYTIILPIENRIIPMVILKMKDEDHKCPFVSQEGCSAYEDRPWPCRMYPLDMDDDGAFHLITDSSRCLGLREKKKWRIGDWLVDQALTSYEEMNGLFSQITRPLQAQDLDIHNPDINKRMFMALYNLDRFREFVFNSTFLDRFVIEPVVIEKINKNDIELLQFGFNWVKFGLFGRKFFKVKETP